MMMVSGECLADGRLQTLMVVCTSIRLSAFAERHRQLSNVTGVLDFDSNLGWKGAEKYVATAPQIFDLWADPQERYDILMNSFTESTWIAPVMEAEIKKS
jgi:hypothetical protein